MRKKKIVSTLIVGNLLMHLPFIISIVAIYFYASAINRIAFLVGLFIIGFAYWSYMSVWFKKYSIKRLASQNEFEYWKRMSINTLLIWPDNFFLTSTEAWKDEDLALYNEQVKELV